ncbi:hypothetical protein [Aurantiacibacter spongiae]|uniref:Uncharacterized protein n=1 Tax=Aurantiacibacter spongiae TaxID=2488860 RepID=A0A3N5D9H7_9SPHN|nr:hypothetical protein [Aurantiacibacter spongiae]RPF71278.1 hypothetical protein EG799_06395 [Aurantiacibacter spongiae]
MSGAEAMAAQFAASLLAVGSLVLIAHRLGFSVGAKLESEGEALDVLSDLGGFRPLHLTLDQDGRGAIARDAGGKVAVLVPHGGRFVARLVPAGGTLRAEDGVLRIAMHEQGARPLTLTLGDEAAYWADIRRAKG